MENQHRKITGYRELTQQEIDAMNNVKAHGNSLAQLISDLEALPGVDQRWVAIAKADLQKGIMSAVRAVARPESF